MAAAIALAIFICYFRFFMRRNIWILILFWYGLAFTTYDPDKTSSAWIAFGTGSILLITALYTYLYKRKLVQAVQGIIEKHEQALANKKAQTYFIDEYGIANDKAWLAAIEYFLQQAVYPFLKSDEEAAYFKAHVQPKIRKMIEDAIVDLTPEYVITDPESYEHFCANLLRENGWQARVTQLSGDQGADIIATRANITLAIQCKLYNQPVGNYAVQEIFAAQKHYQATHGIVVSNASYTKSARKLANSTSILLLHHNELIAAIDNLNSR